MSADRQRAIELGAVALFDLLAKAGMGGLIVQLTASQIQQLQRYLDAAVIDPAVKREAAAVYRGSPEAQRQVDKIMREYIPVGQLDDTVRIDLSKALDRKALAPITDNPDEADYLEAVRKKLDSDGVWLRISAKLVRNPDDPSQWISDGRNFEVWLSLGPRGGVIPAKGGVIDRDALLSNGVIGANYWRRVDKGPVLNAINRQAQYLSSEIDNGIALHTEMLAVRANAAPGVVPISDTLGGADFPSVNAWQPAIDLLAAALKMRNEGRVWGAKCLLVLDALMVRNSARALTTYMDKTSAGAVFATKALTVVVALAVVAETLMTAGAAAGVGAGGAAAGEAAVGEAVAGEAATESAAEAQMERYIARNSDVPLKWVKGPKGTVMRGIPPRVGFQSW